MRPWSEDLEAAMEIDRTLEANVFPVVEGAPAGLSKNQRGRRAARFLTYLIVAALASSLTFGVEALRRPSQSLPFDRILALRGGVALSADELRELVGSQGLTAYWSGAEVGARYVLNAPTQNQVYIRYLPGGGGLGDKAANYRVIGTYLAKSAFINVQSSGKLSNSVGFTNLEGNSVFYNLARPANIYLGMRAADVEIEIYDPNVGQALQSARIPGSLQLIK